MSAHMSMNNSVELARMLIERHGLRAGAVATERASEAQLAGEAAEFHRWQSVQAAISDLRRTARHGTAPTLM